MRDAAAFDRNNPKPRFCGRGKWRPVYPPRAEQALPLLTSNRLADAVPDTFNGGLL